MEFLKKSIHMDQIGCEEQTQITLEDDVNIADAKPDVYQVVTQQGHVELEEVRASDGHVHVKGVLHFKVLYLADEETHHPACMEGELAFEEQILMGSVSGTDQVQAQAILEDLSVGMINSRKLSVQALLQIRLFTERMKQLDVAVGLDGTEQIEVKKKRPAGAGSDRCQKRYPEGKKRPPVAGRHAEHFCAAVEILPDSGNDVPGAGRKAAGDRRAFAVFLL